MNKGQDLCPLPSFLESKVVFRGLWTWPFGQPGSNPHKSRQP